MFPARSSGSTSWLTLASNQASNFKPFGGPFWTHCTWKNHPMITQKIVSTDHFRIPKFRTAPAGLSRSFRDSWRGETRKRSSVTNQVFHQLQPIAHQPTLQWYYDRTAIHQVCRSPENPINLSHKKITMEIAGIYLWKIPTGTHVFFPRSKP